MTICLIFHNVTQKLKICYANRCVVAIENKVLKEKSHINSYFLKSLTRAIILSKVNFFSSCTKVDNKLEFFLKN